MKYKVGDKVRIRKDLKVGEIYGDCLFVPGMQNLVGKIARITEVHEDYWNYRVASSNYHWSDEMFEDKGMEGQKMNKRVVIDAHENYVVARCGDKEGYARCHPDDDFDFYVGAKLALERLEKAENPYAWLKVGSMYYIPSIDAFSRSYLYRPYKYGDSSEDRIYMERGMVFQTKEEAMECARKMLEVVKREG